MECNLELIILELVEHLDMTWYTCLSTYAWLLLAQFESMSYCDQNHQFATQLVFILLEMGEGGDLQYSGMQKFRVECDSQSLGFWVSYFSLHKQASNLN